MIIAVFVAFFLFIGLGFDYFYLNFNPMGATQLGMNADGYYQARAPGAGASIPFGTIIALLVGLGMSMNSLINGPGMVLRSTMARRAVSSNEKEHQFLNIVAEMSTASGLPAPAAYVVPDSDLNAFATGTKPENSVIAVTEGLLGTLNREELQAVVAHEMSHIGNRDMLVSTVVVILVGVIQLLADFFLRSLRWRGGDNDRNGVHPIFLLIGIALAILAPIAGMLIQLAVSRKREYLADASGVLLTRYPDGLASALGKLAQDHTPMRQANHATAHLWLDDPYQGKKKTIGWFANLFMTHPPIEERIKALKETRV